MDSLRTAPNFIFKIGPLVDMEPPELVGASLYCMTGDGPNGLVAMFDARHDREGLEKVLAHATDEPRVCDPALAEVAVALQLEVAEPPPEVVSIMLWTVHAFAMGLDQVTPLFERSNLELLRVCAEIASGADSVGTVADPLAMHLEGDSNYKHYSAASFLFRTEMFPAGDFAYVITPRREQVAAIADAIRRGDVSAMAQFDFICVTFVGSNPRFAAAVQPVLARFLGLSHTPIPFRVHGGARCKLSDDDVLTLAAGLDLYRSIVSGAMHVGRACTDGMSVTATVPPTATPATPSRSLVTESTQSLRFWASIRQRAASTPAPALAQLLVARQEPMAAEFRRCVVLPLAWVAFRFAVERSPHAQLQVPLLLTLMQRDEASVEQFIEHLEHFGGLETELEVLTTAPPDLLEQEILEGLRDRRSGREEVLREVIPHIATTSLPQTADETREGDAPSARWALVAEAIAAGRPVRELALGCAEDPGEPEPVRARAWAEWARRTDDDTAAIEGFRRALQFENDANVTCELADRLALRVPPRDGPLSQVWSDEADEAVATARRALRWGTTRPALAYRAIAFARESQGRADEALRAFGFAIAHAIAGEHPNPRILEVGRQRLLVREGRLGEALARWTDYIACYPDSRRVGLILLTYLQVRLGLLDEALASATEATEQPKGTMALLARGHVRALRGEWAEAKVDLDRFLTGEHSVDEYPFARAVRAWVYEALGVWEAAVVDLTQALTDAGWKRVSVEINAYAHGLPPDRGTRASFEAWRCELLMRLLPEIEHPTVSQWRAQLGTEGAALGSVIAELAEAVLGDDRVLRQAVVRAAPAWVRALTDDANLTTPLRGLRRLL